MKEGAHLAGYSLNRSIENLRWLLEDAKFEQLSAGYKNVNEFLRDTAQVFKLLDIKPEERKQIAELVKDLQPKASQRAIADMVGVSEKTVSKDLGYDRDSASKDAKKPEISLDFASLDAPPPAIPPDDTDFVKQQQQEIDIDIIAKILEEEIEQKKPQLYSSASDKWNTQKYILDLVVNLLGEIDLDPCSNSKESPNVPANNHYTEDDDGLVQKWYGRVYMNPPYGVGIKNWIEKLCDSFEYGEIEEAIALVPARTDTQWFIKMRNYPRCFIHGRLSFDEYGTATFPSMVVYLGRNNEKFYEVFREIGDIYVLAHF